jgi:hypothetical protein
LLIHTLNVPLAASMVVLRLAILYQDWHSVKKLLGHAKTICEAGGDWEHKNKLKVRRPAVRLFCRWNVCATMCVRVSVCTRMG